MKLRLRVWRQDGPGAPGRFEEFEPAVNPDMSFLEMLDVVNEELVHRGAEPIAFDHDCREGICGACAMMINGEAHGPLPGTTTCQLHLRHFRDSDTITVEPFRAGAFPVVRDLVVDRSALDRIIQAGGFISVATGNAPDANAIPIAKDAVEQAMDAAQCIGCGACVAACPNASAMLFTAAKVAHLALLPQGQPERERRALAMVERMDAEGFGGCTNFGECTVACPKEIGLWTIARLNADFLRASLRQRRAVERSSDAA